MKGWTSAKRLDLRRPERLEITGENLLGIEGLDFSKKVCIH
jgi:hypothetical protein